MNYLRVYVYSNPTFGDCTLDGITSDPTYSFVVPHERGPISEDDIIKHRYIVLDPMEPAFSGCPVRFKQRGETRMAMSGGNFIFTTDGRFKKYSYSPCSVHDRIEG